MSLSDACEIPRVYSVQNQACGGFLYLFHTLWVLYVRKQTSAVWPAVTVKTASGFTAVSASNP